MGYMAARKDVVFHDGSYRFFTNKRCQHADEAAEDGDGMVVTYWVGEDEDDDRIEAEGDWGNVSMMPLGMADGVAKSIKRIRKWALGKGKALIDETRAKNQYVPPTPAKAPEPPAAPEPETEKTEG